MEMDYTVGMNTCPQCQAAHFQVKDGLTGAGSQRYRCRSCNHRYTPQPKLRGYSDDLKASAHRMYIDGFNFRRIARHLNVHHQTVIDWINAAALDVPETPPSPETTGIIELDELFTFVGKKKKSFTS